MDNGKSSCRRVLSISIKFLHNVNLLFLHMSLGIWLLKFACTNNLYIYIYIYINCVCVCVFVCVCAYVYVMVIVLIAAFLFSSIEATLRAVVSRLNYLILVVVQWDLYAKNLVRHGIDPSLGLFALTFTMLLPVAFEKVSFTLLPVLSFNLI